MTRRFAPAVALLLISCGGEGEGDNSATSGQKSGSSPDAEEITPPSDEESSAGHGGAKTESDGGAGGSATGGSTATGGGDGTGGNGTGGSTTAPGCTIAAVERAPGNNWSDSYSVDGKCYCATTFDHDIGVIEVSTPVGTRTVRQICDALGPGPGIGENPVYNDVQCGNGPANDAGDEDWCPGRVDLGIDGCCTVGPLWDLSVLED